MIGSGAQRTRLRIPCSGGLIGLLAAGALAVGAGRAHAGRLAVEPAVPPLLPPRPPAHGGFWQALEDAAFSSTLVEQATARERSFADSLRAVVEGRFTEAEPALRELAGDRDDPELRQRARRLLALLLTHESRWAEAETVVEGFEPNGTETGLLLTAFKAQPPEALQLDVEEQVLRLGRSRSGSPVVELRVNGRPWRFWIDTGAGMTVVASHLAEACGLRPLGGEAAVKTATTRVVGGRPTVIEELRLGDAIFRNHPALILHRDDLRFRLFGLFTLVGIDGILGWPAIEKLDLTIDLPAEKLIVRRPRPRRETRNLLWAGYPIVRGLGPAGEPLLLGLDTGARRTSARQRLLDKTGVAVVRKGVRRVGGAGGFVRQETRTLAPVALSVDGCRLRFDGLETAEREHATILKLDGLLGADVASQARLRIDAANGRFDCVPLKR